MSSYLPSFSSLRWTSSLQTRSTACQDAPLSSLPATERNALDTLISKSQDILSPSSEKLPACDPWRCLHTSNEELRDEILIRLLRCNNLSIEKSLKQLCATLEYRATSAVAQLPVEKMQGRSTGIPVALLETKSKDKGTRLFYTAAADYIKKDVDHKIQEVGVAKMFEYMMYDSNGPQVKKAVVVVDFTGFGVRNVDLVATKNGVGIYTRHYPDMFHKILLINYPKLIYGGTFESCFEMRAYYTI